MQKVSDSQCDFPIANRNAGHRFCSMWSGVSLSGSEIRLIDGWKNEQEAMGVTIIIFIDCSMVSMDGWMDSVGLAKCEIRDKARPL